jgi:hypothetical protein
MSDSDQSSIPTIKLKEGEPGISSLSPIGLAFSEAITYINHHKRLNLEEDARKWLIDAASSIIERLKTELEGLYQITSRGDLTKVPLWVTRPSECLSIFIKCPPALSKQYSQEIVSFLDSLMYACGFSSEIQFTSQVEISCDIWFPEAGQEGKYTDPNARDKIFDKSFQEKLVANIKKFLRS